MDFSTLSNNLEKKGYRVTICRTKEEAAAYLDEPYTARPLAWAVQ